MDPIRCGAHALSFERTLVMGVLNVTPDSFSDGGRYLSPSDAIAHARRLVREGADIVDIGGESSRPGSDPVSAQEELRRVLPVIEAIARDVAVPVSIDTCKPEVARKALEAGACIVNDISGLRDPAMIEIAAGHGAGVVVMHMQGTPKRMQERPSYGDVVEEVRRFLAERAAAARDGGVRGVIVDPGIGFGKTLAQPRAAQAPARAARAGLPAPRGRVAQVVHRRARGRRSRARAPGGLARGGSHRRDGGRAHRARARRRADAPRARARGRGEARMSDGCGAGAGIGTGTVIVREATLPCRIGVGEQERAHAQQLTLDLDLEVDTGAAARDDDLSRTASYTDAIAIAREAALSREFRLLETLAHEIARRLLSRMDAVRGVRVLLRKPDAARRHGAREVGVEVRVARER